MTALVTLQSGDLHSAMEAKDGGARIPRAGV